MAALSEAIPQTGEVIQQAGVETTPEALGERFALIADNLITRAFAVREYSNHNVDANGVGIHVYSTNDTGSSGKGGDVLRVGDLDTDKPPALSVSYRIIRERVQLPKGKEDSVPLGPNPEAEEQIGRLGPLTGAYEIAEFGRGRGDYNLIDGLGSGWHDEDGRTSELRTTGRENLETVAASTEAKLEAIRELVEAAETRHATVQQAKAQSGIKSWLRHKLPFVEKGSH